MCGRYSKSKIKKEVEQHFEALEAEEQATPPSYNIAPSQSASIITLEEPEKIQRYNWGLISSRTLAHERSMYIINARHETLEDKVSFWPLLERNRCIILTDGYYEWQRKGKTTIPYRMHFPGDGLFAFAGLWDQWKNAHGELLKTFTIITLPAHPNLTHIHERMPAILPPGKEKLWLKGSRPTPGLLETFNQQAGETMKAYTVSKAVNKVDTDGPRLWEPKDFNAPKVQGNLFG